mmetsp:Transcript_18156/g.59307  ORF Transcript_18156/g.59307 Transcript_18156/m.59307 type:complete len:588 (-) Transcript_18156:61-1824(-)
MHAPTPTGPAAKATARAKAKALRLNTGAGPTGRARDASRSRVARTAETSPSSAQPEWDQNSWLRQFTSTEEYAYWVEPQEIEGELPEELVGTFLRNGPGRFEIGGEEYAHPFDGDGFILRVAMEDGRVHVAGRFVRTTEFEAETEAGKILFRNSFGTQRSGGALANAFDVSQKNVANTNVICWGSRLLALWEAAQPHALDPVTLETIGVDTLNGLLRKGAPFGTPVPGLDDVINSLGISFGGNSLTAHPHEDAATGRLVAFGYKVIVQAGGLSTRITFYEFGPDFELVSRCEHEIDGFAFVHDFAFTADSYVLFHNPVDLDMIPMVTGERCAGQCLSYNPAENTMIHLVPRPLGRLAGKKPLIQSAGPGGFVFHVANAYEEDGEVVIDAVRMPEFAMWPARGYGTDPNFSYRNDTTMEDILGAGATTLWRYRVPRTADEPVTSHEVDPRGVEFPQVSSRVFGRRHRFVYVVGSRHPSESWPLQALVKFDVETGSQERWEAGRAAFLAEPLFVPRRRKAGTAGAEAEDDGFVLALLYDTLSDRSRLCVLDAARLADGPVAEVKLRHAVPYSLHTSFTDRCFAPPAPEP